MTSESAISRYAGIYYVIEASKRLSSDARLFLGIGISGAVSGFLTKVYTK